MTIDPLKLFVIEYSITQNAIHVRSLGVVIENNRRNLSKGLSSDYVPIGLVNSREEGDRFDIHFHQSLAQESQLEAKTRNWHRISEIIDQLLGKITPS